MTPKKNIIPLLLVFLSFFKLANAQDVDVYLAAGQSNATADWAAGIEARLQALNPSKEIVVVQDNHGGNPIKNWWQSGATQANYTTMMSKLNQKFTDLTNEGKTPVYRGLFWWQGEADAQLTSQQAQYADRFEGLVDAIEADMGVAADTTTVVITLIQANPDSDYTDTSTDYSGPLNGVSRQKITDMRATLEGLTDGKSNRMTVDSTPYSRKDGWHLVDGDAYSTFGTAIAQEYHETYITPLPTGTPSGTDVDVYLVAGQSNATTTVANALEARLQALNPDKEIVVVQDNHGGNPIRNWWNQNQTPPTQSNYTSMLNALNTEITDLTNAGKNPTYRGLFWWQGEADAQLASQQSNYATRFEGMLAQLESDMGVAAGSTTVVLTLIEANPLGKYDDDGSDLGAPPMYGVTRQKITDMRGILQGLANGNSNRMTVDSRPYQRGDSWHPITEAYTAFGTAMAQQFQDGDFSDVDLGDNGGGGNNGGGNNGGGNNDGGNNGGGDVVGDVDVFLTMGQMNADSTWNNAIQTKLNALSSRETVVVYTNHSASGMGTWWGDSGAQSNYNSDLAALQAEMTSLTNAGKTPVFKGVIFWGGETTDPNSANSVSKYASRFTSILAQLESDMGVSNLQAVIVAGALDSSVSELYGITQAEMDTFRQVIFDLGTNNANITAVDSASYPRSGAWTVTYQGRLDFGDAVGQIVYDNILAGGNNGGGDNGGGNNNGGGDVVGDVDVFLTMGQMNADATWNNAILAKLTALSSRETVVVYTNHSASGMGTWWGDSGAQSNYNSDLAALQAEMTSLTNAGKTPVFKGVIFWGGETTDPNSANSVSKYASRFTSMLAQFESDMNVSNLQAVIVAGALDSSVSELYGITQAEMDTFRQVIFDLGTNNANITAVDSASYPRSGAWTVTYQGRQDFGDAVGQIVYDNILAGGNNGGGDNGGGSGDVDVYLAAGQSNATADWAAGIEARLRALNPSKEIVVVQDNHGGNPIKNWWQSGATQANYTTMMGKLNQKFTDLTNEGKTPVYRGLFWWQGEADAQLVSQQTQYADRFEGLVDAIESDMGVAADTTTVVITLIQGNPDSDYTDTSTDYSGPLNGVSRQKITDMRAILEGLTDGKSNRMTVDSTPYSRKDGWHLVDGDAYSTFGTAIAQEYHETYITPLPTGTPTGTDVDVYLVAGQSNATTTVANALQARLQALNPDKEIVVVQDNHGGQSISTWWTDSAQENYDAMKGELDSAFATLIGQGKTPTYRGLFWWQGEADAQFYSKMASYPDRFNGMVASLESDMGAAAGSTTTVITLIEANPLDKYSDDGVGAAEPPMYGVTRQHITDMRTVLTNLAAGNSNRMLVDSRPYQRGDGWHPITEAYTAFGTAMAQQFQDQYISSPGDGGDGGGSGGDVVGDVDVFLTMGQMNADSTWNNAIQTKLNALSSRETVVVYNNHSASGMGTWWGDSGAQSNYNSDLAALQAEMTSLTNAGKTPVFKGVIFWGGETTDPNSANSVSKYASRFTSMLAQFESDMGVSNLQAVIVAGALDSSVSELYGITQAEMDTFRQVIFDLGTNNANITAVDSETYPRSGAWTVTYQGRLDFGDAVGQIVYDNILAGNNGGGDNGGGDNGGGGNNGGGDVVGDVDVFLTMGQMNADSTWNNAIQTKLNQLSSRETVVVYTNHSASGMGTWWGDSGAQSNYNSDLAALQAEMTSLTNAGKTPVFKGVIFWGGETTDPNSANSVSKYASRFTSMLAQFESDMNVSNLQAVIVAGALDDSVNELYGITQAEMDTFRQVIFDLGTNNANITAVDSSTYPRSGAWTVTYQGRLDFGDAVGQIVYDNILAGNNGGGDNGGGDNGGGDNGGGDVVGDVDVFLTMGQMNADSTWNNVIQTKLNQLSSRETVVVYTNHSASGMGTWWGDSGAQSNYNSDLAALQAEMTSLTNAGKTPVFKGVIFWGGETTDPNSANSVSKYASRFTSMLAQFESDMNVSNLQAVIVAGALDSSVSELYGITQAEMDTFRQVIFDLGTNNANITAVDSETYPRSGAWTVTYQGRSDFGDAVGQIVYDNILTSGGDNGGGDNGDGGNNGGGDVVGDVDVFLTMGQMNADSTWNDALQNKLNELRPDRETVVVYTNHSASGMGTWWNDDGAQANYTSDLAALQTKMSDLSGDGKTPVFKGIFFWGGDTTDAGSSTSTSKFGSRFQSMVAQFESDMNVSNITAVVVAGALDDSVDELYGITQSEMTNFRNALIQLGQDLANGFTADSINYERSGAWTVTYLGRLAFGADLAQTYYDTYWAGGGAGGGGVSYADWQDSHFAASGIPTNLQAKEEDPDADGYSNLMEYAIGLDPTTSEVGSPLAFEVDASMVTRFTYRRHQNGVTNADLSYTYEAITYRVEATKNLSGNSWSHGTSVIQVESITDIGDGMDEVEVSVISSFDDAGACFVRLNIIE